MFVTTNHSTVIIHFISFQRILDGLNTYDSGGTINDVEDIIPLDDCMVFDGNKSSLLLIKIIILKKT